MINYKNDPKRLTAKYKGKCCKCSGEIKKGDDIVFYPIGNRVYCSKCGNKEFQSFVESAIDEYNYNNGYGV